MHKQQTQLLRSLVVRVLAAAVIVLVVAGAAIGEAKGELACAEMTLFDKVKALVPELRKTMHKGEAGKIAVVGGSFEYTGAPYYAAISTLKAGGDLAWVICSKEAAFPIKSYSPEIIVLPSLANDQSNFFKAKELLSRVHALVVGPGLGRDESVKESLFDLIESAQKLNLPIVFDGDGLFLVSTAPHIVKGYQKALLTPNKVEFERLFKAVMGGEPPVETLEKIHEQVQSKGSTVEAAVGELSCDQPPGQAVCTLAKELGHVTILQKGEIDIISNGVSTAFSAVEGSSRRCGGQGDVLAGTSGLFLHWAFSAVKDPALQSHNTILAGIGASVLTRTASRLAFAKRRRGMTTPDLIEHLAEATELCFPSKM